MKPVFALFALVFASLPGCSIETAKQMPAEDPPGTFQMMGAGTLPSGEAQLVVIDTRRGKIGRCTVFGDAVRCAPDQPVFAPR